MYMQIWLSAAGLTAASVLGSLLGFVVRRVPHSWNDVIMGYCAGIMLAVSVLGLLLPASEMVADSGFWMVVVGALAGALFLNVIDLFLPHLHQLSGIDPEQHHHNARLNRVLLFVLAIAIHKLPEGIAAGVGFNAPDADNAWTVTWSIALQNIPEGMVVITPLLLCGVKPLRTFVIALVIALLEVVGVWLGYALGAVSEMLLPVMLAFAGGTMLYVVSDEMIPETHAHGYQKSATYALLAGFLSLMLMERFL